MADFDPEDLLIIIPNKAGRSPEWNYDDGNQTLINTSSSCSNSSDESDICKMRQNMQRSTSFSSSEEFDINSGKLQLSQKKESENVAHPSKKSILKQKKEMKPACTSDCSFLCNQLFTGNDRLKIFKDFWSLTEKQQNSFFTKYVSVQNIKRRIAKNSTKKQKSFRYYLKDFKENVTQRVCQTFFLNTLSVSKNKIYYHFKNLSLPSTCAIKELQKGKRVKHVISNETKKRIREHIKSFPVVEPHYCRAGTSLQYLEESLTIGKMFRFFKQKFSEESVSLSTYKNIFKKEFNLGFFVPKNDRCDLCILHENLKESNTLDESFQNMYEEHCNENIWNSVECEKDRAIKSKDTLVIYFDLQTVFTLPKGFSSIYYYTKKLSVFNMTATVCSQNDKESNTTYCAIWDELHSDPSGNDLASAIAKILQQIVRDFKNVEHLILWSDSCITQNKNHVFSTALMQFMHNNENVKKITHKFSELGHNQIQEVDAVHAAIDRHLKMREMHCPLDLIELLKTYKSPKDKLIVLQMVTEDFQMYSEKSKILDFRNVPFDRVKSLQYEQNKLFTISYKSSLLQEEYMKINIKRKDRRGVSSTPNILFEEYFPLSVPKKISSEKINGVKSLYKFLSLEAVAYYNNLFNTI